MSTIVPITSLEPSTGLEGSTSIRGVVTLVWPFSSSKKQCAILLAEPDFRLRNKKGQVRVCFAGSSAKAIGNSRLGIGDQVILNLEGARWSQTASDVVSTPGKSVDGELVFSSSLRLQILGESGAREVSADAQDEEPCDGLSGSAATPAPGRRTADFRRSLYDYEYATGAVAIYSSPAFVKRLRLSGEALTAATNDPFSDIDVEDDRNWEPRKRRKIEWRYTERSPSPVRQQNEDADSHETGDTSVSYSEKETSNQQRGFTGNLDALDTSSPLLAVQNLDSDNWTPSSAVMPMASPSLPRTRPRQNIAQDETAQTVGSHSGEQHRPSTPKLQPLSSSTLPLPSPFPVESYVEHANSRDKPSAKNPPLKEDYFPKESGATVDPEAGSSTLSYEGQQEIQKTLLDLKGSSITADEHARSDIDASTFQQNGSDSNHPSDTEEDEDMYTQQFAHQSSSQRERSATDRLPSSEFDRQMHEDKSDKTVDANARVIAHKSASDENKGDSRQGNDVSVPEQVTNESDRNLERARDQAPTHQAQAQVPDSSHKTTAPTSMFGFDGTLSLTPPKSISAEDAGKAKIMKQTFQSLFGFKGSESPERPRYQPTGEPVSSMDFASQFTFAPMDTEYPDAWESPSRQGSADKVLVEMTESLEASSKPQDSEKATAADEKLANIETLMQTSPFKLRDENEAMGLAHPHQMIPSLLETQRTPTGSGVTLAPEIIELGSSSDEDDDTISDHDDQDDQGDQDDHDDHNDQGDQGDQGALEDTGGRSRELMHELAADEHLDLNSTFNASERRMSGQSTTHSAKSQVMTYTNRSDLEPPADDEVSLGVTYAGIFSESVTPLDRILGSNGERRSVLADNDNRQGIEDDHWTYHHDFQPTSDASLAIENQRPMMGSDHLDQDTTLDQRDMSQIPLSTVPVDSEGISPIMNRSDETITSQWQVPRDDSLAQRSVNSQNDHTQQITSQSRGDSDGQDHLSDASFEVGVHKPDSQRGPVEYLDDQVNRSSAVDIALEPEMATSFEPEESIEELFSRPSRTMASESRLEDRSQDAHTDVVGSMAEPLRDDSMTGDDTIGVQRIVPPAEESVQSATSRTAESPDADMSPGAQLERPSTPIQDQTTQNELQTTPHTAQVRRSTRKTHAPARLLPGGTQNLHDTITVASPTKETPDRKTARTIASELEFIAAKRQGLEPEPLPPTTRKHKPAKKSIATRLSSVPDALSTWFSPRRSTRLHPEEKTGDTAAVELPIVAEKLTGTGRSVSTGIATAHSYFAPLSNLQEKLNPSSQSYMSNTVDLIVVVADETKKPEKAKTGPKDYFTIFGVSDPSLEDNGTIRVEVYRPWHAQLPVALVGDVVLLRGFAVKSRRRQPYLLSTDSSAWCVWRYNSAVAPTDQGDGMTLRHGRTRASSQSGIREEVKGPPVELGQDERTRAQELHAWWQALKRV